MLFLINWWDTSELNLNIPSHVQYSYLTKSSKPDFVPDTNILHHVLHYQIEKLSTIFKNILIRNRDVAELRKAWFFFCLQLLIVHDTLDKDGIREQAVVPKIAKELRNNFLKECCKLLNTSFIFAIIWETFHFKGGWEWLSSWKDFSVLVFDTAFLRTVE